MTFPNEDLVVFSHLRWDSDFQRPQHLMIHHAMDRRVFFFEEPSFTENGLAGIDLSHRLCGVVVVTPHLPEGIAVAERTERLRFLVDKLLSSQKIKNFTAWYYTPMALSFTDHLEPTRVIYDCMEELSAFPETSANSVRMETDLLARADLVFTGGQSLYEAKRHRHPNMHPFPSNIDVEHFRQARARISEPDDQRSIPGPRLGYFGVIDERFDAELVRGIAKLRPDWEFIILGPVVKIDPSELPRFDNIHYLGMKDYELLPRYIAGWDIAMLPFVRNESTRFISPTKTPEYLAAGRRVVSTSIRDVIRPYAEEGLVGIADTPKEFIRMAESMMGEGDDETWLSSVDEFLKNMSWDRTYERMAALEAESRVMPNWVRDSHFIGSEYYETRLLA